MAYERSCMLCHTSYSYCPYCDDYRNEPRWKSMYHDENCMKIVDTLQRHFLKEYTDEQALTILKTCDLSVLPKATEQVQKEMKAILKTEKKPKAIRATKTKTE